MMRTCLDRLQNNKRPHLSVWGQVCRGENTEAALQLERLLLLRELADFSVMLGDFGGVEIDGFLCFDKFNA
jgi:hypothetical protein